MAWTPPFQNRPAVTDDAPPAPVEPPAAAVQPAAIERHDDVVARVRELIGKYPTVGSRQLFDLAVRMHPDLEDKGFRSFHARYVLPLLREKARAEGRTRAPRTPKTVVKQPRKSRTAPAPEPAPTAAATPDPALTRARVREVLLRLARQVAIAESRADLVDALARVEDMVDEVMTTLQPTSAVAPESS